MAAIIQVWSGFENYGGTCVGVLAPYQVAAGTESEGTASTLRVVVPRDVARDSTIGEGHLLRIVSLSRGTQWWWVTQIADADGDAGMVTVTAGTLRQLLAVRGLVRSTGAGSPTYSFTPGRQTPTQLINSYILSNQSADGVTWLQLGSIAFTDQIEIGNFDRVNRGTILDRIEQQTGFVVELEQQFTAGQFVGLYINLAAPVTSGTASVLLSSGAQIETLQRTRETLQSATVAVPFSASGEAMRECVWKINAISGTGPYRLELRDLTSGLPFPIRENDQLNGYRVVQRDGTATAITDSFASDSAVEVASIGTLAVNEEIVVLTSGLIPPQEVTSPSGLASSRGRLVATVATNVSNVGRRQLLLNNDFTQWTSFTQAVGWSNYQNEVAACPPHAQWPRATTPSGGTPSAWTAKISQALNWDTGTPVIYKTLDFSGAPANSWLYQGEVLRIHYGTAANAPVATVRVQDTVQANSSGNGTVTLLAQYGGTPDGLNTNFIFNSSYPGSVNVTGTVTANDLDIFLFSGRPSYGSFTITELRGGFDFKGGVSASQNGYANTKVKVFYTPTAPYLHFSASCTEVPYEPFYGGADTPLVRAGIGLLDVGPGTGGGVLLASATAGGTAPDVDLTGSTFQQRGVVIPPAWTIVQSNLANSYLMTADKEVRLVLYPARCRNNSGVGATGGWQRNEASAATHFHTASMSLSATATAPTDIPSKSGSNLLWHRAQDVLQGAAVSARYQLRGVDLEALQTQVGVISLGQLVRIRSERLNLDATVRVIRLDFSYTDVEALNLELGTVAPRLTGVTVSL